jgi:glyoxylase-like metal-dependent hydrolase (beta-lactamase superfamily II)
MVAFSILKTSENRVREALTFSGGDFRKTVTINYGAVLVEHDEDRFLFDSGLGINVDAQYCCDMPRWKRPLLKYGPVDPVRRQLERHGIETVPRIVLSHSHWDHASGIADYPEAEIWIAAAEHAYLQHLPTSPLKRGATMPSQVHAPAIRWHVFDFEGAPYGPFEASLDLFGDGTAVLVPLRGHTPGSTGLMLTLTSGKRFLFCGDTVWNASAIARSRPKTFVASIIADDDRAATLASIELLRDLAVAEPALTIVPAHDGAVQDRLGYFPARIS